MKLDIWYVSIYEPLPLRSSKARPMRNSLVASALTNAGHKVELWLPGFEHVKHTHFKSVAIREFYDKQFSVQYLEGCGYSADTSVKRLVHNRQIAKSFIDTARVRSKTPDIVITQIPSLELAECVIKYCTQSNIPCVIDVRDLWPDNYKRILPKYLKFLYPYIFYFEELRCRRIFNGASAIIAISQTYLDWAISKSKGEIPSQVFHIGYRAPPKPNFKPNKAEDIRRSFGLLDDRLSVFFAGTFCSSYDLETVYKASLEIEARGIPAQIIIAGDGSGYEDLLKRFSESRIISYVGWLESRQLTDLLSICDVGLAPYSSEAFMSLPNKPFEYLANGLPILSSLKGELWDLIQKYKIGFNYQSTDINALVDYIEKYSVNKVLLNHHKNNCLDIFRDRFDSGSVYSKLTVFIEQVLRNNGRT